LQQVARDWAALSTEESAAVFQETFPEASILPNLAVLDRARAQATDSGKPVPVALVAVNDNWSVYAIVSTLLAVGVFDGETISLATLSPDDVAELGIPWPEQS